MAHAIKLNALFLWKFGDSRMVFAQNERLLWNPLIWIVGPNRLERIQVSGLDVNVSHKDGFLATFGMKSAVYSDPPLGCF
jgi:hypothetical protein